MMVEIYASIVYRDRFDMDHRERFLVAQGPDVSDDRSSKEKQFMQQLMSVGKRVVIKNDHAVEEESGVFWILPNQVMSVYFFEKE